MIIGRLAPPLEPARTDCSLSLFLCFFLTRRGLSRSSLPEVFGLFAVLDTLRVLALFPSRHLSGICNHRPSVFNGHSVSLSTHGSIRSDHCQAYTFSSVHVPKWFEPPVHPGKRSHTPTVYTCWEAFSVFGCCFRFHDSNMSSAFASSHGLDRQHCAKKILDTVQDLHLHGHDASFLGVSLPGRCFISNV